MSELREEIAEVLQNYRQPAAIFADERDEVLGEHVDRILALLDEPGPVDEELLSGLGDAADILGEVDVQAAEYVRIARDRLAPPPPRRTPDE